MAFLERMMYFAYKLSKQGDNILPWHTPFPYLEPVCCFMSSSNCCFLTCIQVSQEAVQVIWYSHVFQRFSQSIVIHKVKGFGIVNKAKIDVFLKLFCFFEDPVDVLAIEIFRRDKLWNQSSWEALSSDESISFFPSFFILLLFEKKMFYILY